MEGGTTTEFFPRYSRGTFRGTRVVVILFLLLCGTPAAADERSDRREVLTTVQRLFDALGRRDAAAIMAIVVPEGTIAAHLDREGAERLRAQRWREWANGIREGSERLEERMHRPRVRIRGDMASVWTEYSFYRNGTFSHCGVDLFDMARVNGRWRVLNLSFTIETQGCRRR